MAEGKNTRYIDIDAARMVLTKFHPAESYTDTQMAQWIASQLGLKAKGRAHEQAAVAVYEEHAKTT